MLAYEGSHHGRAALVDASKGRDLVVLQDVLDQVYVASVACPVEIARLGVNRFIRLDFGHIDKVKFCYFFRGDDRLGQHFRLPQVC